MNLKSIPFAKRTLMVALLAGSGALVATAFAMPGGGTGPADCAGKPAQQAQTPREAYRGQRLAGLKAKLQLKPEQEAAWQSFATATQPMGKGIGSQAQGEAFKPLTTPQRMDRMLARADERRARMAQRAEAVKQFYAQLSPEQQQVFDAETLSFRHGHHRHGGGPRQAS